MDLKPYVFALAFGSAIIGSATAKAEHLNKHNELYEARINATASIEVILKTVAKVEFGYSNELGIKELKGDGFVVGNYVLTLDHVVSVYERDYSNIEVIEILDEKTHLDGTALHEVINDEEVDIGVFDLSKTPELCKKYCNDLTIDDLMTSDELKVGMMVYWNESPGNLQGIHRKSYISKKDENPLPTSFAVGTYIMPGTSGIPVWYYDESTTKQKIVGVVQYLSPDPQNYTYDVLGFAKYMDDFIEEIRKYEKEANDKIIGKN